MPLTPAEKQRRYREKMKRENPEKFAEMKKKTAKTSLKYYKDKVSKYTEEEKEKQRQLWRDQRKRQKDMQVAANDNLENLESRNEKIVQATKNMQRRIEHKLRNENESLCNEVKTLRRDFEALKKKMYRYKKKMVAMRININNAIENANKENNSLQADKKFTTIIISENKNQTIQREEDLTPLKRTEKFIDDNLPSISNDSKEKVKKTILQFNVLKESIKQEYNLSKNTDKTTLKRVIGSDVVRKYKLKTKLSTSLGLKSSFKRYRDVKKRKQNLMNEIAKFYEKDDVSRATSGKKEYKTFNKIKRQRRYLMDSLKNLHRKYLAEGGRVSFSTFKKYRPFHVLSPKITHRDTCVCIKHANMQFMLNSMISIGLTERTDLNSFISTLVCDLKSYTCMYSSCEICSEKKMYYKGSETNINDKTTWLIWILKKHEYGEEGQKKFTKRMVKEKREGTIDNLIDRFNTDLNGFKRHLYNIYHQYQNYKFCQTNLNDEEALIHVDFSENYSCKLHEEVQAMHFGASKTQVTLHTGVLYVKDTDPISFCSISPSNLHNPEAIWAHLDPVLNDLKSTHPNIKIIHFFSDGPSTQYRQKKNFFLFSKKINQYGFNDATWNFFESNHGKGAADGVGGAVKRALDSKVSHGHDISDAMTAFEVLSQTESSIKKFYIPVEAIKPLDEMTLMQLVPLPNTLKIHQIIFNSDLSVKYRDLSCFCAGKHGKCECYTVKRHDFDCNTLKRAPKQSKDKQINKNPKKRDLSLSESSDESNIQVVYEETDESTGDISDYDKENGESSAKIADTDTKLQLPVYQRGDFVIFRYDSNHFPGQVKSITEESVLIKSMTRSLKNWKWPPKEDLNLYSITDVIQKIKPPIKIHSKREVYQIKEMAHYYEYEC